MGAITRHLDGTPVMLPSDVESLVTTYDLTQGEAELAWHKVHQHGRDEAEVVEAIRQARVVYRPTYDQIPAEPG